MGIVSELISTFSKKPVFGYQVNSQDGKPLVLTVGQRGK
jgi:hypothetical protein